MHKKLTIIAVTAILLTSCVAMAVSPSSYESDAASENYEYIGFGGELTAEAAILFLLQEEAEDIFGDDLGDELEDLIEGDKTLTIDDVKKYLGIKYSISKFSLGGSVEIWFNAKYNSTDMDMSFAFNGEISINIDMTDNISHNKIIFDDVTLACVGNGNIAYALGGTNDSFYVNASGGIILDGKTNLTYDKNKEKISFGKESKPFNYNIGFASDLTVSFPNGDAFAEAKRTGYKEADINITGSYGLTSNIDGLQPLVSYVTNAKKVKISYDAEDGYEIKIGKLGIDLPLTATDKKELDEEIKDLNEDIPSSLIIGRSVKITESKYNEITSHILSLKSKASSNLSKLDVKVTYVDSDGKEIAKKTIPFGSPIEYIEYNGEVPEGKRFVGWSPNNAVAIKNSFIALGDITMKPIFATVVESGNIDNVLATDNIVVVSINVGESTEIPLGKISKEKMIIIEIKDGTEIISKWTITGDQKTGTIESLKLGVTVKTAPDSVSGMANGKKSIYLDFEAHGTMPGDSSISYNVSDTYRDGTNVEIYHVEEDKVTKVAQSVVNNGFIDIPTSGFSGYFIQELESAPESDSGINTTTIALAVVAVVIIAGIAFVAIRKH